MVPVCLKTEIQYEPAMVSVMVQYLARTGRCARFVSVGLYFDISSPRFIRAGWVPKGDVSE